MQVTIFKPAKSAMQSGNHNSDDWQIKFPHDDSREIESVMGWTSSGDTMQEVNLKFASEEAAIAFCQKNDLEYEVLQPQIRKATIRPYASNFK